MGWGIKANVVSGFLQNGLPGALDAHSANSTQQKSIALARESQERQIEWEREKATHAHQWEMEDLRKAGLNPILAANSGATAGSISPLSSDLSQTVNSANSIRDNSNKAIANDIQAESVRNQLKAISAQAELSQAKAMQTYAENKWIDPREKAHLEQTFKTISNIKANTAETQARIDNIKKDAELKQAQIWESHHRNRLTDAQSDKIEKGEKITTFTGTRRYNPNKRWNKTTHQWEVY